MRGVPEWLKSLRLHKWSFKEKRDRSVFDRQVPVFMEYNPTDQSNLLSAQVHPHCDVSQLSWAAHPQWATIGEDGRDKGDLLVLFSRNHKNAFCVTIKTFSTKIIRNLLFQGARRKIAASVTRLRERPRILAEIDREVDEGRGDLKRLLSELEANRVWF